MHVTIEFEFVFRYPHLEGNLRYFTEEELLRIEEILGEERTFVPATGYSGIKYCGDLEAAATQALLAELEGDFGREIVYYGSHASTKKLANGVSAIRRYVDDAEDMDEAAFFYVWPAKELGDLDVKVRWETGEYALKRSGIKRQKVGALGSHLEFVLCRDEVRMALEEEGFCGLGFEEVRQIGKSKKAYEAIWRLRGESQFPRCRNEFVGEDYVPLDGYSEEGSCHVADRCFPFRLRYSVDDIEEMKGVDVAETCETFGWVTEGVGAPDGWYRRPYLVVSQRFRRFCDSRKLKLKFYPIEGV